MKILFLACVAILVTAAASGKAKGSKSVKGSESAESSKGASSEGRRLKLGSPKVRLDSGRLRGKLVRLGKGKGALAAFEGVPYAAPPTRFAAPLPVKPWKGTLKAIQPGPKCIQKVTALAPAEDQSEDCLTANVYLPAKAFRKKRTLPVMVWVHGGSFKSGAGSEYNPTSIATKGVVMVTLNYRLGALGYFYAPGVVPANLGMRDQVAALQWVKDNIAAFGGDPDKVTVFGESAGSASISLLSMSPSVVEQKLFSRVVLQSGSGSHGWAVEQSPFNPGFGLARVNFAAHAGCANATKFNAGDFDGLAQCLQDLSVEKIREASGLESNFWSPSIDGPGGLLPAPVDQLAAGRDPTVQVVAGINRDEMALFYIMDLMHGKTTLANYGAEGFQAELERITPEAVFGAYALPLRAQLSAAYANPQPRQPQFQFLEQMTNMMSDFNFNLGMAQEAAQWLAIGVDPFLYEFHYESQSFPYVADYRAVFHAQGLFYQFPGMAQKWGFDWTLDETDQKAADLLTTTFTNFAISGSPNEPRPTGAAEWGPAGATLSFLNIDQPDSAFQPGFANRALSIWKPILDMAG